MPTVFFLRCGGVVDVVGGRSGSYGLIYMYSYIPSYSHTYTYIAHHQHWREVSAPQQVLASSCNFQRHPHADAAHPLTVSTSHTPRPTTNTRASP
jgi:hypothetical protein